MVCFLLVYLSLSLSFQPALVFIQNLQAIEQHSRWHVLARIRRHVEPLPPVVDLPEGDLRFRMFPWVAGTPNLGSCGPRSLARLHRLPLLHRRLFVSAWTRLASTSRIPTQCGLGGSVIGLAAR